MKREILNSCKKIVDFISNSKDHRLGIVMSTYFDGESGEWTNRRCSFDDIGDYLHYVVWYGQTAGKDYVNFAMDQINAWQKVKSPFGFYLEYFPDRGVPGLKALQPVSMYQNQDALVGLLTLYRMTKNDLFLDKTTELCNSISKYAVSPIGFVYNKFIPYLKLPLFKHHKSEIDGLIIEELCELYGFTRNEKYLNTAKKIAKAWMNKNPKGLFLDRVVPILNTSWGKTATMMKSNTNMLFGLIALYEVSKDRVIKKRITSLLDSIQKMQLYRGGFAKSAKISDNTIIDNTVELTQNFAVIDVFLEAYRVFKNEEYLEIATNCAKYWMGRQDRKTGLFPERVEGQKDWYFAKLDQNSDLIVELLKLYEITKKKTFLESAEKAAAGIMKHHQTKTTFAKIVDYRNGRIIKSENEIKYLGGLLKALLLTYHVLNGGKIYRNKTVYSLVRDR